MPNTLEENKLYIYQSWVMAKSFLSAAKLIHGDGFSSGENIHAFYLLVANALELFPKVYIWNTSDNMEDKNYLVNKTKEYGHNLERLYKACPTLMAGVGIKNVHVCSGDFLYGYEFILSDNRTLRVVDSESGRFGMLAPRGTGWFSAIGTKDIIDLGTKLQDYTCPH